MGCTPSHGGIRKGLDSWQQRTAGISIGPKAGKTTNQAEASKSFMLTLSLSYLIARENDDDDDDDNDDDDDDK